MPAAERLAGGAVRTGRNGGRRRCSLNQPRLLERVVGENNAFLAYVSAFSTRHQFPRCRARPQKLQCNPPTA